MEVVIVFLLALDWFVVGHGDSPNCDPQDRLISYRTFRDDILIIRLEKLVDVLFQLFMLCLRQSGIRFISYLGSFEIELLSFVEIIDECVG